MTPGRATLATLCTERSNPLLQKTGNQCCRVKAVSVGNVYWKTVAQATERKNACLQCKPRQRAGGKVLGVCCRCCGAFGARSASSGLSRTFWQSQTGKKCSCPAAALAVTSCCWLRPRTPYICYEPHQICMQRSRVEASNQICGPRNPVLCAV